MRSKHVLMEDFAALATFGIEKLTKNRRNFDFFHPKFFCAFSLNIFFKILPQYKIILKEHRELLENEAIGIGLL